MSFSTKDQTTMTITTIIDQLDTLVTNGAPVSQIKSHLMLLREQAEALECRVLTLETEAKSPAKDILIASLQRELDKAKKEKTEIIAYYTAQPEPIRNTQYT
jgi:hypothetical protein